MRLLVFAVVFLFTVAGCGTENNLAKTRTASVLVQELMFNIPQESYFLGSANLENGKLHLSPTSSWASFVEGRPECQPTGILLDAAGGYRSCYERVGRGSFVSRLYDPQDTQIFEVEGKPSIFWCEGWWVQRGAVKVALLDISDGANVSEEHPATASTCHDLGLVRFTSGRIYLNDRPTGSYEGLITEAGRLEGGWLWYVLRPDEKTVGRLYAWHPEQERKVAIETTLAQMWLWKLSEGGT